MMKKARKPAKLGPKGIGSFTVRLTRQELITIEIQLRAYAGDGEEAHIAMAEGFNESIKDLCFDPLEPMTGEEAVKLADRLVDLLDEYDYDVKSSDESPDIPPERPLPEGAGP
jgi:hypothetical protein